MTKTAQKRNIWWYQGRALVDGALVCEAQISAMMGGADAKPCDAPDDGDDPSQARLSKPARGSARMSSSGRSAISARRSRSARTASCTPMSWWRGERRIGARARIFPFASIGTPSQDLKAALSEGALTIGADCIIREGVTINAGAGGTRIGDALRLSRLFACRS